MNSQNDSVIICDSPSPSKPSTSDGANYRKRLRSSSNAKSLLDTVYESPLVHLRRNVLLNSEANTENDANLPSTPPPKRRKVNAKRIDSATSKFDQSVVILNESIVEPSVEVAMSDVETTDMVEVSKPSARRKSVKGLKKKLSARPKTGAKSPKAKRRTEKLLRKKAVAVDSAVNDENRDRRIMKDSTNATGETEDIEIVWVSGPNSEPAINENPASEERPFVVDKEPTPAYLTVKSAFRKKDVKITRRRRQNRRNEKNSRDPRTLDDNPGSVSQSNGQNGPQCNGLREIVIDGCNVAMGHKNGQGFSEKGLQIVIDYFKERGHVVRVFLPQSTRARERALIEKWHTLGYVIFTPSRRIGGRDITPYDDRFILEYATKCNGIVISSDQFRDMWRERPEWRNTIENRLLAPTFVGDYLMFPEDPLGRRGPSLEEFLRH